MKARAYVLYVVLLVGMISAFSIPIIINRIFFPIDKGPEFVIPNTGRETVTPVNSTEATFLSTATATSTLTTTQTSTPSVTPSFSATASQTLTLTATATVTPSRTLIPPTSTRRLRDEDPPDQPAPPPSPQPTDPPQTEPPVTEPATEPPATESPPIELTLPVPILPIA